MAKSPCVKMQKDVRELYALAKQKDSEVEAALILELDLFVANFKDVYNLD